MSKNAISHIYPKILENRLRKWSMSKPTAVQIFEDFYNSYTGAANFVHKLYHINDTNVVNYLMRIPKKWRSYKKIVKMVHALYEEFVKLTPDEARNVCGAYIWHHSEALSEPRSCQGTLGNLKGKTKVRKWEFYLTQTYN